ncbi:MFS general substrate transporter [Macrolepiota fuliginosa MF-IS2]|uniref:MFS general substrate transporter n=1 Tax=Macrolepiota fuliginosa MF-IS2 TaxID=1400762 RepID=A0A9P5XKR3_9AGAR|nr:MFS general substrate transporter [Macrolepiota fuliginosa MF-IS2]
MTPTYPEQTSTSIFWKTLACCSIVTNALCSGGIFIFPLMSPVLADRCRLTQPQLTTVVLAAMMGQYPFAALAGKLIDRHGPSLCSAIAAVLYSTAFSAFSYHVYNAASDATNSPVSLYLTLSFGLAGLGTVFSYFSFLFAASRLFPKQPGVASGTSMALFGLSPLFLTSVASNWFTNRYTGVLQVVRFTAYLAVATGVVHLMGAVAFSRAGLNSKDEHTASRDLEDYPTETTRLLPPGERPEYIPEVHVKTDSTLGFLKHPQLWLLVLFCICIFGAGEMVISNIGTIVAALPADSSDSFGSTYAMDNTPQQVRMISIANTFTRIFIGPLADYVSPVASYLPNGTVVHARKHRISRISFLFGSATLLALTFFYASTGIKTQGSLWILSLGIGMGYSATFTVVPSIVSSIWGLKNLGRNFGILMYAPFIGTPMFSYFYAFVSQSHTTGGGICRGPECWQTTFRVATVTSLLALAIATTLWRQWRGRL